MLYSVYPLPVLDIGAQYDTLSGVLAAASVEMRFLMCMWLLFLDSDFLYRLIFACDQHLFKFLEYHLIHTIAVQLLDSPLYWY